MQLNPLYSFKKIGTNVSIEKPFEIHECNEMLWGEEYFKHGEFLINISYALTRITLLNIDIVYKIGIFLSEDCIGKFFPNDEESTLKSLITLLENIKAPTHGVHYTFFLNNNQMRSLTKFKSVRSPIHVWRLDQGWIGDGDYILVRETRGKDWMAPASLKFAYEQADDLGLKVKVIKYGQSAAEQIKLIRHAKCIVTERGGHVVLCAMMGIPLILSSNDKEIIIPNMEDELGGFFFETDTLGLNPDTLHLENDKIVNKRYDRGLITMEKCDQSNLIKDVINGNIPQIQIDHVRKNRSFFNEGAIEFMNRLDDICKL